MLHCLCQAHLGFAALAGLGHQQAVQRSYVMLAQQAARVGTFCVACGAQWQWWPCQRLHRQQLAALCVACMQATVRLGSGSFARSSGKEIEALFTNNMFALDTTSLKMMMYANGTFCFEKEGE